MGNWLSSAIESVRTGFEYVRQKVGQAIDFLADGAEEFVAQVKETWKVVSPYLKKLSPLLKGLAAVAPYPWLKAAILAFDIGLQALLALENSPVLKKVEAAIHWAIKWAREHNKRKMTEAEQVEARKHQETLRQARAEMPAESQPMIDMAELVNNYVLVKTAIDTLMDTNGFQDFAHFLRLRATQKMLNSVEQTFGRAQSVAEISTDDMFMMRIAEKLLSEKFALSDSEAQRLDRIIEERYQKKLMPFVFEEMTKAWQITLNADEARWKTMNLALAKEEMLLNQLKLAQKLSGLSTDEAAVFAQLEQTLPTLREQFQALGKANRRTSAIVHASEGFIQLQEKTEAQLIADDQVYLIDQAEEIALILIDFMQNGRPLNEITEEQQMLITDYANIFAKASEARAQTLIVECNA